MRKITGQVATFVFAAALAAFASACTSSPLGPNESDDDDMTICYTVNGHLVCLDD